MNYQKPPSSRHSSSGALLWLIWLIALLLHVLEVLYIKGLRPRPEVCKQMEFVKCLHLV